MKLYLAQHGDATPKEINPDRPLSEKGKIDVARIARFLSQFDTAAIRVMHSGKLRARQTAELLAEQVMPGCVLETSTHLNPLDPPAVTAKEIALYENDMLLVGHLPHLAKLAPVLLTGDEEPAVVRFTPATVACLQRNEDQRWSLAWLVSPELIMDNN